MPMFPDSGVPANEAKNTIDVNTPAGCNELWYSTARCQPRFDPAAANAMLAEDMNLIMKGELQYDCARLDHIERAVRYINQRGLPRSLYMQGGPAAYWGGLDPAATRLSDYMTLTVVPSRTNNGPTTLDIGLGASYILRTDGQHLEREDLKIGKPQIIAFFQGYWYFCGLAASQVPIVVKGGIDAWIRTDGNDFTGDGTANTADKAFRTIQGCWNAIGSRFAATPMFSINMKLGIPGTYTGAIVGPFGGSVTLYGDPANPGAYRVSCAFMHPGVWSALWCQSMASFGLVGITLNMDYNADGVSVLRCLSSKVSMSRCQIEVLMPNPTYGATLIEIAQGGGFSTGIAGGYMVEDMVFIGNNHKISNVIAMHTQGTLVGNYHIVNQIANWHFQNLNTDTFFSATGLTTMNFSGCNYFFITNCIGRKYAVFENSIINLVGLPNPGNVAGIEGSGGRYIP